MVILSLDIDQFGKFTRRSVALRPGVNIITGNNDSGKTTLAAYAVGMLYGIQDDEIYERYLPYDFYGVYGGKMKILCGGRYYEITRSFVRGSESLSVKDLNDGRKIAEPEKWLLQQCGGVDREAFLDAALISRKAMQGDLDRSDERLKSPEEQANKRRRNHYKRAVGVLEDKRTEQENSLDDSIDEREETLHGKITAADEKHTLVEKDVLALQEELSDKERLLKQRNAMEREDEITGQKLMEYEDAASEASLRASVRLRTLLYSGMIALGVITGLAAWFYTASYNYDLTRMNVKIAAFAGGAAALILFIAGLALLIVKVLVSEHYRKEADEMSAAANEMRAKLDHEIPDVSPQDIETVRRTLKNRKLEEEEVRLLYKDMLQNLEKLKKERAHQENIGKDIRAINLAAESLKALSATEDAESHADILETANRYYKEIEKGDRRIALTEENEPVLIENGVVRPLTTLSEHAVFSVLFALRLARLGAIDPEKTLPLILDDALTSLDRVRMGAAMELVRTLERQIILLSCQTRERQTQYESEEK